MPSAAEPVDVLNRVLMLLRNSFPQYLLFADPYVPPGRQALWQAIVEIADAEESLAVRVSEHVIALGGLPESGEFPMEFTDTHDLSIDYQVREAIGYQRQDIAALEECARQLSGVPYAESLSAEALEVAHRQLGTLEKLPVDPGAATIIRNGEPARDND